MPSQRLYKNRPHHSQPPSKWRSKISIHTSPPLHKVISWCSEQAVTTNPWSEKLKQDDWLSRSPKNLCWPSHISAKKILKAVGVEDHCWGHPVYRILSRTSTLWILVVAAFPKPSIKSSVKSADVASMDNARIKKLSFERHKKNETEDPNMTDVSKPSCAEEQRHHLLPLVSVLQDKTTQADNPVNKLVKFVWAA